MTETTVAVISSAVAEIVAVAIAAGLAYWGVVQQMRARRLLEKQTNSINVMLAAWKDHDLLRAFRVVVAIHDDPRDNVKFYAYHKIPDGEDQKLWAEKSQALFSLVNYFETVSGGICQDIYDWKIIHKIGKTMFTTSYKRTKKFIEEVRVRQEREGAKDFGRHFEEVALGFSSIESEAVKFSPFCAPKPQ